MGLKFQFNKVALQTLKKQLNVRLLALPTLQSKEAALRLTVKQYQDKAKELKKEYEEKLDGINNLIRLWGEFDWNLLTLKEVQVSEKKIAGVSIPIYKEAIFEIKSFSGFNRPLWYHPGIKILQSVSELILKIKVNQKAIEILEYARKKTTQKVNLYEKVQIPAYKEALIKIKRFLEDVENLEKAAQKITKQRLAAREINQ